MRPLSTAVVPSISSDVVLPEGCSDEWPESHEWKVGFAMPELLVLAFELLDRAHQALPNFLQALFIFDLSAVLIGHVKDVDNLIQISANFGQ